MSVALVIVLVSSAILAYVLFGYPALLALGVFRAAPPPAAGFVAPSVSLILPVRNGERWIRAKLESILRLDYPAEHLQVIVVSDGSTDGTEGIVRSFPQVQLLARPARGKASAINAGLEAATGELLFFTDVRQELEAQSLRVLAAQFSDSSVGAASGELIIRPGARAEEEQVGRYWSYEKLIRKRQSQIDSVIGATGAIYAMRRELARPLPPDCLLDDVHLPLEAFFRGYRVIFVEEARAYDQPTALEREFRRKVRTLAGNYQLLVHFPALLTPRNRMWFHYLSHKLGRLLLPFALLALLAASGFLPRPWSVLLLAAQAAGYGAALADLALPESVPGKRLTAAARTFAVLMLATLAAASYLLTPGRRWWSAERESGKAG
jgi:cellulose synthase/poly-beta-1,6-N-acetylglucosamine synthase-like glycosyltransferase